MQVVRVRVPLARPLVRFTLKRAIRMMPSVLLLMFVFSLIFVTLMQIAVIHANRRAHYIHRHELNLTSPLTSQPQSHQQTEVRKPQIPVVARVTKPLTKKPETLRVEALLDRNAPSVETNILLLQSRVNTARLKQVLRSVRTLGNNATTRGSAIVSTMSRKPLCPAVPTGLLGRIKVDLRPRLLSQIQKITKLNIPLKEGELKTPINCTSRHRVAVIIPFRDRLVHLAILLYTLHPILQRQLLEYKVYVIEQYGEDTFNKGVLMNAGVKEALREFDFHCFVFHDVDLIPEDDRNFYSCPEHPRHMSVAVDKFNYT
ncbi:beta-1,4-galactosyltransferase 1-like [Centruroides sculpturatus]|uniref:beta-1,4-galactosyltransferase 1-like n=1 Tax=Centruroides sculpturatus TaxID=218467 RepID=UPI000C6E22B0|nr:beta-1,4-galactosyltransferase 1-like [Centruroides sculpturatus]